jgi:hypothetical protein
MTWPLSKTIICTDDQTEVSGTKETLQKDRMLQKHNRLRWEKPLRDELCKLRAEKILSEKSYTFEKHYYETKLKDFKGKRILSAFELLRNKSRKECSLNLLSMKIDMQRRMYSTLVNKLSDSTELLPRKNLKWSLNDLTETKTAEQEAPVLSKTREKLASNCDKLPTIFDESDSERVTIRKGKRSTWLTRLEKQKKGKPNRLPNAMLELKGLPNNLPPIIKESNH